MFLNGLKVKSILRKLKKNAESRQYVASGRKITSLGLLQDEAAIFDLAQLLVLVQSIGLKEEQIQILTYKNKIDKEEKTSDRLFSDKQIGWNSVLKASHLKSFSEQKFDILISYFSQDQLSLKVLTSESNAVFKVGIGQDGEGLHDLVIHTKEGQEAVFVKELVKYLEILKIKS